jgi:hypothetical protein
MGINLKSKILSLVSKKIIGRNKKFKGMHQGESCYLFGNGSSLKCFDLKKFDDKISIGCNGLFLHRDFKDLSLNYYYHCHAFFDYPYWVNPLSGKFVKNVLGSIYKEKYYVISDIPHFVNLSNYFGLNDSNIYYIHHFDKPFDGYDEDTCRVDNNFTCAASSLGGMIGLAIYMGFKDITLVGCDHSLYPNAAGHFYEFGRFADVFTDNVNNEIYLLAAAKYANLRIVSPNKNYRGHILPSISYEELTGDAPVYKENNEIISKSDLLALSSFVGYKIFPNEA